MSELRVLTKPVPACRRNTPEEPQLGCNLKDNSVTVFAAVARRAIHVPAGVEDQGALRKSSVVAAGEIVKRSVCPTALRGSQLET